MTPAKPTTALATSKSPQLRRKLDPNDIPTPTKSTAGRPTSQSPLSTPELDADDIPTPDDSSPERPTSQSLQLTPEVDADCISTSNDWTTETERPTSPASPSKPRLTQRLHQHEARRVLSGRYRLRGRKCQSTTMPKRADGRAARKRKPSKRTVQSTARFVPLPAPRSGSMEGVVYNFRDRKAGGGVSGYGTVTLDLLHEGSRYGHRAVPFIRALAAPPSSAFDLSSREFIAESLTTLKKGDFRYHIPCLPGADPGAVRTIQRALMLTYMDFVLKTGEDYPWDLVNAYQGEGYTSQYHRLQERCCGRVTEMRQTFIF